MTTFRMRKTHYKDDSEGFFPKRGLGSRVLGSGSRVGSPIVPHRDHEKIFGAP